MDKTYYAGKSKTLRAVATMAHCASDGYSSDMEASVGADGGMGESRVGAGEN